MSFKLLPKNIKELISISMSLIHTGFLYDEIIQQSKWQGTGAQDSFWIVPGGHSAKVVKLWNIIFSLAFRLFINIQIIIHSLDYAWLPFQISAKM